MSVSCVKLASLGRRVRTRTMGAVAPSTGTALLRQFPSTGRDGPTPRPDQGHLPPVHVPLWHFCPVGQQTCLLPPQHVPLLHVPREHAEVLPTHSPVVSQQPSAPGAPLHTLPAQHASFALPHCPHWPPEHTTPLSAAPHAVPGARQLLLKQQLLAVHCCDAQHWRPASPHALQVPF